MWIRTTYEKFVSLAQRLTENDSKMCPSGGGKKDQTFCIQPTSSIILAENAPHYWIYIVEMYIRVLLHLYMLKSELRFLFDKDVPMDFSF